MNKEREKNLFVNNPFIDGLFEWMDSPRSQLSDEVREAAWQHLEKVDVDAINRRLIWGDGRRLSIDESMQRIHGDYPDFPVELIETHLIAWLEMEFAPGAYSHEQLDELDRLKGQWVNDHYTQRQTALTLRKTRYSQVLYKMTFNEEKPKTSDTSSLPYSLNRTQLHLNQIS